jgi:hypothetical protein
MAFWSLIGSLEISPGKKNISPHTFQLVKKINKFNQFQPSLFYLLVWDNFPIFVLPEISKLRGNSVFLYSLLCIHILYEWTSLFFSKKKRKIEKGKKYRI